ncbi:MAG: xanthine dehydrogenase family protein molybdopterin-binding subunit [Tenericutes bacterium]|jgi:CO/xanthine dehydrogenase Mo-binding subunit|nr:xanthine dehydrogenase family protein molybdopterin-binding subunit [Mycoplasmatota bacterium]
MKDISKSINKVDNEEKISGKAKYVADYTMDGMLYAMTKRSSIAKGEIVNIEYPDLPKGYFIVNHKDVQGKNIIKMIFEDWPVFTEKNISYLYEPIMLVIGPEKSVLVDIIEHIKITYKEEKPIFAWTDSVIDYHFDKGHGNRIFDDADEIIEHTYETGYQEQAYIEPQGFIGYPEGDKTTLVGSIQCPYYVKNAVIQALGEKDENVRVIQANVGGAFGGKEEYPSLIGCQLAVAVKKIKKPIKLIFEREEDMLVTTKRHPSKTVFKAAIKNNQIIGLKAHVSIDAGATIGLSGVVLSRALLAVSGAYTIDHLDVSGDVYRTNTVPNGAFRGFGAPQMFFAVDMFIEHIAKSLNFDPLEFRENLLVKQGDRTSTNGLFREPVLMPNMIKKVIDESDYKNKIKQYSQKGNFKGIGMSLFFHGCGFTGSGEKNIIKAKVRLKKTKDGKVHILVAAVDMGQGIKTTFRKLIAHMLELDIEEVVFNNPDTDFVPDSGPTVASRTMMIVGGLLARAAKEMKSRWKEVTFTVEKEYEQPDYIKYDELHFIGDAYPAYSWGVNIVEVEVDPVTYQVYIKKSWSVYDVGKAIDEKIVLGQADGGLAQGLAYGYLEVMNHKDGKIMQKNMTDYIIPTAMDMGEMETYLFDNPYAYGPYGAKGVGELPLIGGPAAVAKAIESAINKNIYKIPVTPEYIMELMNND